MRTLSGLRTVGLVAAALSCGATNAPPANALATTKRRRSSLGMFPPVLLHDLALWGILHKTRGDCHTAPVSGRHDRRDQDCESFAPERTPRRSGPKLIAELGVASL